MKDFIPKGTGNSRNLKSAMPAGTTWEQALAQMRAGTFPIDLAGVNAAGVQQMGDALNKANLLSDQTAAKLWPAGQVPANPQVTDVLGRLGGGVLYNGTVANTYLSDLEDGTMFRIDEKGNGVLVPFVKLKNNYVGSGRVAVARHLPIPATAFSTSNGAYTGGSLDISLNTTYFNSLSAALRGKISSVTIPIYSDANGTVASSVSKRVFAASRGEVTGSGQDGTKIVALKNILGARSWSRTAGDSTTAYAITDNLCGNDWQKKTTMPVNPVFTLPADFFIRSAVESTITDLFGSLISIPASQIVGGTNIVTDSYVGTGTYGEANPNVLTFDFEPQILFITAKNNVWTYPGVWLRDVTQVKAASNWDGNDPTSVVWKDGTILWFNKESAEDQYNSAGAEYLLVAAG